MNQNDNEPNKDLSFANLFSDAKPVVSDKYVPSREEKRAIKKKQMIDENLRDKQASASFEFSDGFEARFSEKGPLKYVKEGERSDLVKMARKGEIQPELILDLHGFNSQNAKHEIAALLFEARKKHYQCVCIVHGVGSGILKQRVPSWLVQHPHVLGFHQAPLEWGGNGALLVLIEQEGIHSKYD
ncbi:endonuclease SmrB [Glaciecola sp. KUL10]|uniref:endonuclease SmrB n=1 Tax=Glaciecola sp. (strain KUL10) TaxID=2161813 RepID=UPI000D788F35|nr:endonuclease SmrB [Glaciecola sp. KUL10]GBL03486.1 hypothetical protein KUL10_07760 [Glaciecola sp. KUL10]